jgi:penicillin-binding protein 2
MPVFNQSRGRIVQIIFSVVFIVIIGQLINLQLFSAKYKLAAENNALFRKIIYPDRGIIFDRKRKAILENINSYDLVVIPAETKGMDTLGLCTLLNIDTSEYKRRMRDIAFKTGNVRPGVFEALLTPEMYARLNENIYKFPGFSLTERSVRSYPYSVAAHVLGYTAEVDTGFLRLHKEEGYQMGDYAGRTGLEKYYEKVLMGQRGVKNYIRDNKSRIQGDYEKGMYDTAAIAGNNIHLSLDVELQKMAEQLMTNKVGSIVAIDPKTGGILCMVSAPTYDPNYLTGNQRKRHIAEMSLDPRAPFNNRGLGNNYNPGSTFKTIVGIVGLTEGVITERTTVTCPGYFTGCGNGKPKCLDKGTFAFKDAVAHSDNSYFCTVYKRLLDQPRYHGADSALTVFNKFAYTFGLGHKLGVDIPTEKSGIIPTAAFYNKKNGSRWNSCTVISNAIGQGEVNTTMVQLANVMAIIANKGWYYTPHFVDSIEGGDEYKMLDNYKIKHYTDSNIPDSIFDAVQDGMQAVVDYGTAAASAIPGIVMCGKTGTVQNSVKINGRSEPQQDHSFFGAFAPRGNPRIAIAVICENAGQGAWAAAPIASLLVEKYLRDSITGKERKDKLDEFIHKNLIPRYMRIAMATRDSLKQIKESQLLQQRMLKEANDSTESEENAEPEIRTVPAPSDNKPMQKKKIINTAAVLTNEDKKNKKYTR